MSDVVERLRRRFPCNDATGMSLPWQAAAEVERLRAELAAVRHHLEAAYEAMGVPLIMSRPLSCYINDLRKELAAERAARIAVGSPVRREGE